MPPLLRDAAAKLNLDQVGPRLRGFAAWARAHPKRAALIFSGVFLAVVALVLVAWVAFRPPAIDVVRVAPRTVEIVLSVVGRVRPLNLVDVRSPNAGQVIRLFHDDGDVVAAGAPLAVVRAAVEQAQTEAGGAREQAARAEVTRARLAYQRTQTLAERGFASPAALDEARATLRAAEAALAAASAERRAAAAQVSEFTIRAPMAGVVLVRPIDNGQVVSPDTMLFQLGSLDGVEIQADVDEAYADALRPGMGARAALSGSDDQFSAHIIEVSPRVDASTGGRLVKLAPEGAVDIAPGRSVDVTIVVDRRENTIVIPRQAVIDASAAPKVYVVAADGVVRVRPVEIAAWPSLNAIIESGLAEGDRVVLAPEQTRPSARVRAVDRAGASGT